MDASFRLREALFATEAIRFAPHDQPFWYTSGMIGPYYVNTHFLCGGEQVATGLLERIEALAAGDRLLLTRLLADDLLRIYANDAIYRNVIDALLARARAIGADCISGGERRDFFFSIPVAALADLPHVSIFKDGVCMYDDPDSDAGKRLEPDGEPKPLSGLRVLHIADIVTQAASFTRLWIPALRARGAHDLSAMAVLDRLQDGRANLRAHGVDLHVLDEMDENLFSRAHAAGILTQAQWDLIRRFNRDPLLYMRDFFSSHPHFIAEQLAAGGKSRERALLCIRNGFAPAPPDRA